MTTAVRLSGHAPTLAQSVKTGHMGPEAGRMTSLPMCRPMAT